MAGKRRIGLGDRRIFSADDARSLAQRRLPRLVFDFVDGSAGSECAPDRNCRALEEVLLQPRVLGNVGQRSLATTILNEAFDVPFGIAPMGMCGLATAGADAMLAQAAVARNMPIGLSSAASMSIEDLNAIAGNRAWFQLYAMPTTEQTMALVDRARASGYETLILTVDVPQVARRLRDVRNGFEAPFRIGCRQFLDFARHPAWSLAMWRHGRPYPVNLDNNRFDRTASRAGANWAFLGQLRDNWRGKLIVKGVMSVSDALRIRDAGADAIWVSNHGGRQLASAPATANVLPLIRAAVGADYPLIFDSGVRSGEDVVKALALGADFVMLGRPLLFALGANGAKGLDGLLDELTQEISTVMAQIGACKTSEIGRANLHDKGEQTPVGPSASP
jgi:isopentenyl diphosphate isomerase/L-lactate dehydrogenase-like FMN-dependent dehydrogenase